MKLWSDAFENGSTIPKKYAFGRYHPESHVELSENVNPPLAWSGLPAGTKSLVLICHDADVPTSAEKVNKEGMTVPASLKRADFFHWVLVDLAPDSDKIAEGAFSNGITARGKPADSPQNTRQGLNNYTQWFEGDSDMAGQYFGYDGPCPPWNDEIVHHYHFTLYAIDLPKCPVDGAFDGAAVLQAIQGHILGKASIIGKYAIYPDAKEL